MVSGHTGVGTVTSLLLRRVQGSVESTGSSRSTDSGHVKEHLPHASSLVSGESWERFPGDDVSAEP